MIYEIEIPKNKTGEWLLDSPTFANAKIGEYDHESDENWTWEVHNQTIRYTDKNTLANELEWTAKTADDIADDEFGFNRGQSLAFRRMANQYRKWADQVRK